MHADFIRKTEVLGDIGYWEDRVRFIANHAAPAILALLDEHERQETEKAHLRDDIKALRHALGNVLALLADRDPQQPDIVHAMEIMVATSPEAQEAPPPGDTASQVE